ncbi:MAG: hypothetical protein M1823_000681 [Watsoniomyces obsoletus]|nr:MAG: hypothetical protein M1823_000681 [Watsoniomyces obsoletus]
MKLSSVLVLPFITGALAIVDFRVPWLRLGQDEGRNRTVVRFLFEDNNTNATKFCQGRFPSAAADGTIVLPTSNNYFACGNDTDWAWKFNDFTSIRNFQLELLRSFRDSSIGEPPMDRITLFGYRNITEGPEYTCRDRSEGRYSCRNADDAAIIVPVTAAVSKKKK